MADWSHTDIMALEGRFRANLINTIAGFKPALLVGTASAAQEPNLAVFSNIFHIGASPPLIGLLVRPSPEGTERHTLENILDTKHFTLNHFSPTQAASAHYTSARFNRPQSEFLACGFDEQWREDHRAPYVAHAAIQIGLELVEHQLLAVNQTHLLIGSIRYVYTADELVRPDGSVNLEKAESMVAAGLDSYHSVGPGQRFDYAKPDQPPRKKS